jgi:hypothetical protein
MILTDHVLLGLYNAYSSMNVSCMLEHPAKAVWCYAMLHLQFAGCFTTYQLLADTL